MTMTSNTITGVRGYQRFAITNSLTKAMTDRLLVAVIVGLAGAGMGFVMGPMYLALEDVLSELLAQMPDAIMAIAGGVDMATPAGWYTGEMYSIVFPFAVMFVAANAAARAFGGEMENRTIGLVMATPNRRTRLAAEKAVAMVVHVVVATTLLSLGVWLGAVVAGVAISLADIAAIGLMLALVSCAVGGLSMVVSIVSGRGVLAILVAMLAAIVAYVWSSFVPLAEPIADLAWLSPWHHYIGTKPMSDGVDWLSAAWLAILALVSIAAGVYLFRRRDIAA
jgi:beta-exotoxin I transport system permease protein